MTTKAKRIYSAMLTKKGLVVIVITSIWILDTLLMSSNDLDCLEAPFSKEVDAVVEMYPQINLQIISVQTS